ncbi:unnamed protein product, partial [Ectocarpus sp. 12 AP-2014]
MPLRYNEAVYKDSVGALLQRQPVGTGGNHDRRHRGGGSAVKNYRLDNRANIKEIQALNRQRREEEAAPPAEPFKLRQFKNVKSRFASTAATGTGTSQTKTPGCDEKTPPASRDFLRRGTREKVATELRQAAVRRRQENNSNNAAGAVTATGSKLFGATGTTFRPSTFPPPPNCASPDSAAAFGGSGSRGGSHGREDRPSLTRHEEGASSPSSSRRGRGGGGAAGGSATYYRFSGGGGGGGGGGGCGVTPRKEAVPRAEDVAQLAPRSERDFVAANRMQGAEMKAKEVSKREKTFTH